jgi:4-hydroxybenzoate polyprenyltransferase
LILFLYFLLPANLLIYSINDIADEYVDSVNIKKQDKELRVDNSNKVLVNYAFYISLFISFLILILLKDEISVILFLIFLFLGIFYSLPPLRFKTKVLLDFISNGFYIIPGIVGFYEASSKFPQIEFIYASLAWAFAMHLFSAVVDIDADRKANIVTSATFLGRNKSLLLCFAFWILAWILVFNTKIFGNFIYLYLIYPILPIYMILDKKVNLEKVYWIYPLINLILGFIIFLIVIN